MWRSQLHLRTESYLWIASEPQRRHGDLRVQPSGWDQVQPRQRYRSPRSPGEPCRSVVAPRAPVSQQTSCCVAAWPDCSLWISQLFGCFLRGVNPLSRVFSICSAPKIISLCGGLISSWTCFPQRTEVGGVGGGGCGCQVCGVRCGADQVSPAGPVPQRTERWAVPFCPAGCVPAGRTKDAPVSSTTHTRCQQVSCRCGSPGLPTFKHPFGLKRLSLKSNLKDDCGGVWRVYTHSTTVRRACHMNNTHMKSSCRFFRAHSLGVCPVIQTRRCSHWLIWFANIKFKSGDVTERQSRVAWPDWRLTHFILCNLSLPKQRWPGHVIEMAKVTWWNWLTLYSASRREEYLLALAVRTHQVQILKWLWGNANVPYWPRRHHLHPVGS